MLLLKTNSTKTSIFMRTNATTELMSKLYMDLLIYLTSTSLIAPHLDVSNTSELPSWLSHTRCKKT